MNNFIFNFLKEEEEKKQELANNENNYQEPIPEVTVNNKAKKKKSLFNLFPGEDPRKEALIKLSIGFGFCVVLIILVNIFGSSGGATSDIDKNKDDNTNNTNTSVFEYVKKNNYTFEYQINTHIDSDEQNYTFKGYNDDSIIYGERISNNTKLNYKYVDNYYYCMQDDVYTLCDVNDVFLNDIHNYIDLDFIEVYINKGRLEYTTSYTDGGVLKNYSVYLKDFIASYTKDDYFVINLIEYNDLYNISVDYTNLSKYSNPLVLKFVVDMKIGKVIGSQ